MDVIPDAGDIIFITPNSIQQILSEAISYTMTTCFQKNSEKIKFHEKYELLDIDCDSKDQINVSFMLETNESDQNLVLNIQCQYLLYFGNKTSDPVLARSKYNPNYFFKPWDFLQSLTIVAYDSGILFNGGIVIDSEFRTNDPWIYGVGYGTRFSRKVHERMKKYEYMSCYELCTIVSLLKKRGLAHNTYLFNHITGSTSATESIKHQSITRNFIHTTDHPCMSSSIQLSLRFVYTSYDKLQGKFLS